MLYFVLYKYISIPLCHQRHYNTLTTMKVEFKDQLKNRRKELGLVQEELILSGRNRISLSTIKDLESGRQKNPGMFVIQHLQTVLKFKFDI